MIKCDVEIPFTIYPDADNVMRILDIPFETGARQLPFVGINIAFAHCHISFGIIVGYILDIVKCGK